MTIPFGLSWWRARAKVRLPNTAMWCSLLKPGARQYQGSLAERGIDTDLDIWVDRDGALKLGALVGKRSLWTLLEPTEVGVEPATVIARFKAAIAEIEARGN
jgi:hypothetical protein